MGPNTFPQIEGKSVCFWVSCLFALFCFFEKFLVVECVDLFKFFGVFEKFLVVECAKHCV